MSDRPRIFERPRALTGLSDRRRLTATMREKPAVSPDIRLDPRYQFDAEAWIALLLEQRLRIAAAAGVHPSRVKIQIGNC